MLVPVGFKPDFILNLIIYNLHIIIESGSVFALFIRRCSRFIKCKT